MDTMATVPVSAARRARTDMVRRLVAGGGRFSTALGIDVEAGEAQVDRWFMAATLFGARIPTAIAGRTFHVLDEAGVTVATARAFGSDDLVALLDRGGYARYDYKTATRLQALCDALGEHYGGRVCAIPDEARTPAELEEALDELPGWGPVTVGIFLRELRGAWTRRRPHSTPARWPVPATSASSTNVPGSRWASCGPCRWQPVSIYADLEGALVRTALAHRADLRTCPGGRTCSVRAHLAPGAPAPARTVVRLWKRDSSQTDRPGDRGFRHTPRAAGHLIEAWGPDRVTCMAEAVGALVSVFADLTDTATTTMLPMVLESAPLPTSSSDCSKRSSTRSTCSRRCPCTSIWPRPRTVGWPATWKSSTSPRWPSSGRFPQPCPGTASRSVNTGGPGAVGSSWRCEPARGVVA